MAKRGDKKFTLYWKTGDREVVEGRDIAEAMTLAGYGGGAAGALEVWTHGDNHNYIWNAAAREWEPSPDSELAKAVAEAKGWSAGPAQQAT